jgi:lipooligosaccharide transport system permease protein
VSTPRPLRVVEAGARRYRHTWRASVISSFLNPVLLLVAMGIGLGSLVDEGPEGLRYLTWLAPALLAAAAMQTAAGESSYPVMAGIKWIKSYDAALSTPIEVRDLVAGHIGWATIRVTQVSAVFALMMTVFGVTSVSQALLSVIPGVLTGFAFAGPVTAYTARLQQETGLSSLFRFVIVPLFLFSGTFFPISQLPAAIQPVAYATPLWHGVEMARGIALGIEPSLPIAAHAAYLVVVGAAGSLLAVRILRSRLVA